MTFEELKKYFQGIEEHSVGNKHIFVPKVKKTSQSIIESLENQIKLNGKKRPTKNMAALKKLLLSLKELVENNQQEKFNVNHKFSNYGKL